MASPSAFNKPVTLSASAYGLFDTCPYAYFFKYKKRTKVHRDSGLLRRFLISSVVHDAGGAFLQGTLPDRFDEQLPVYYWR